MHADVSRAAGIRAVLVAVISFAVPPPVRATVDPPASDAPRTLQELVADLDHADPLVRERAAAGLGRLGPAAAPAIDPLARRLADPDPYVAGRAADALARLGPESVPRLVAALADARDDVRRVAAIGLGKVASAAPGADPALASGLAPGLAPDLAAALVPALARALDDRVDDVRGYASVALGAIGPPARPAVPALLRALADRDAAVRRGAALALAQVDPTGAAAPRTWEAAVATLERLTPALMAELHVPGVAIALVRERKVAWTKTFGVADAETSAPVTDETLFEAASMTKPVFAYTALKLAEQGALDLDRPLVAYTPDEILLPDQPGRRLVTARHALSHTTGFPNWRPGDEERDGPLPLAFEPGARFGYSGEGIFAAQRAVEAITGEPLDAYARRTLFAPLGLAHTSYVVTPELAPKIARGHDDAGRPLPRAPYRRANAAYSLYTTARDYAAFLVEILKEDRSGPASLSRASRDALLARAVAADGREPIERPFRARGTAAYWGLGFGINATGQGDIAHHAGANRTGFRAFSQFSPSRGTGLVILTNGTNGAELWTRLVAAVGDL